MTHAEFVAEGKRRFGDDSSHWKFVCPVCKHVASVKEWRDAGAGDGQIAFSCIGRNLGVARNAFEESGKGPCNYAGGGLFRLNPMEVDGERFFAFAEQAKEQGEWVRLRNAVKQNPADTDMVLVTWEKNA